jgi:hypothetical protein
VDPRRLSLTDFTCRPGETGGLSLHCLVLVRSASEFGDAPSRHVTATSWRYLEHKTQRNQDRQDRCRGNTGGAHPRSASIRCPPDVVHDVEDAPTIDLPAGVGCEFPLRIDASAGKVRVVTFEDENGDPVRTITVRTGVVLTYTNLTTDESISFKTSGSVQSTVFGDEVNTVTLTGHNGLILFPSDSPEGPTTTQYTGKIVYTDAAGTFTLLSTSNEGTDVCAALS